MQTEWREDILIFRAGRGQWCNQPHSGAWDMGEDTQDLPAAPWLMALEAALAEAHLRPRAVVVDATAMSWLVGQDWGFLGRLAAGDRGEGIQFVVVGNERIRSGAEALGLGGLLRTSPTVGEAVRTMADRM